MKKRFNIYCVLLIGAVVFGVSLHAFQTAGYMWVGAKAGWTAAQQGKQRVKNREDATSQMKALMHLTGVETFPKDPMLLNTGDSIVNLKTGEKMPIAIVQSMAIPMESQYYTQRRQLMSGFGYISLALIIAFWTIFIKFVMAVNKGRLFEQTMERQLTWGGWLVLAIYVVSWAAILTNYHFNTLEFEFEAYTIHLQETPDNALLYTAFGMLLMGQIFKIGRKLKEEQELTI